MMTTIKNMAMIMIQTICRGEIFNADPSPVAVRGNSSTARKCGAYGL